MAANGEQRHESGTVTCEANGAGSVAAIVKGENSDSKAIDGSAAAAAVDRAGGKIRDFAP